MNRERNKRRIVVSTVILVLIIVFIYMILYGGQFSFFNLYKSKKVYQQAVLRNEELQAENDYLEKNNIKMQNDPKVQIRSSAEIGYKEPEVQIIKKTKKRENSTD